MLKINVTKREFFRNSTIDDFKGQLKRLFERCSGNAGVDALRKLLGEVTALAESIAHFDDGDEEEMQFLE